MNWDQIQGKSITKRKGLRWLPSVRVLCVAAALGATCTVGCEVDVKENPTEEASEAVKSATEKAKDAVEDAKENAKDTMEDVNESAKDAMEDAKDN